MFETVRSWVQRNQHWIAILLIVSGFVFYLTQSIYFAHTIPSSVWDEGMYVYKGYLFSLGEYTPFEDSGPWTNQMPFAYFLAGMPQVWFGHGFRTGRYLAVAMGTLAVIALAFSANRLGGKWWAAALVWTVGLNTGWVMAFSQLFSQGMVSFLLAWAMVFIVGRHPKAWELITAALLAGLAGMVRINMLPLVFILILYIFWQYGYREGLLAAVFGLAPVIFFHISYWPDILKIWAYWIPEKVFPLISDFRSPWREIFLPADFSWWPISSWWKNPEHLAWFGLDFLIDSLRANFVSWFGVLLAITMLPWKGGWRSDRDRRLTIFLFGSYGLFLGIHTWAALGGKTCRFVCLPGYFLFFNWLGLLGIISSASSWRKDIKIWPYIAVILVAFLSLVAFEYQYENNFRTARSSLVFNVLGADKDTLKNPAAHPEENAPFWKFVKERFGFDRIRWLRFVWLSDLVTKMLWWILPGLFVFGIPWLVYRLLFRNKKPFPTYRIYNFYFILFLGAVFSSKDLFVQPMKVEQCDADVIQQIETVGAQLAEIIPAGSEVFWDVKSNLPLSYIPDVELYLPQLNHRFTLVNDPTADSTTLDRFGWWNLRVGEEWIEQADYIVVESRLYDHLWHWDRRVAGGEFSISLETSTTDPCRGKPYSLIVLEPNP